MDSCNKKIFKFAITTIVLNLFVTSTLAQTNSLPDDFVYLSAIDPSIRQDMRYAGSHNFIGSPVSGYKKGQCILTKPAALALAKVQKSLLAEGFSLQVYDCYRPQTAVNSFITWSQQPTALQMKAEFYPRVNKADFFDLGYVAKKSGHTRGSTVDLTIVPVSKVVHRDQYVPGQQLVDCTAPYRQRFVDGSIDMGTGYDCLDPLAHDDAVSISKIASENRSLLKQRMQSFGFEPYDKEWWHFTLKNEPHPDTYYDFPVE